MFELRLLEFTYVVPSRVAPWSPFLSRHWMVSKKRHKSDLPNESDLLALDRPGGQMCFEDRTPDLSQEFWGYSAAIDVKKLVVDGAILNVLLHLCFCISASFRESSSRKVSLDIQTSENSCFMTRHAQNYRIMKYEKQWYPPSESSSRKISWGKNWCRRLSNLWAFQNCMSFVLTMAHLFRRSLTVKIFFETCLYIIYINNMVIWNSPTAHLQGSKVTAFLRIKPTPSSRCCYT